MLKKACFNLQSLLCCVLLLAKSKIHQFLQEEPKTIMDQTYKPGNTGKQSKNAKNDAKIELFKIYNCIIYLFGLKVFC